jgi:hypothetical protein
MARRLWVPQSTARIYRSLIRLLWFSGQIEELAGQWFLLNQITGFYSRPKSVV